MAVAKSAPGLPVAVIVYAPADTLATTNEAVNVPPEIEQVDEATAPPVIKQEVSRVENPEPETITSNPIELEVGLSVMVGVPPMTVRVAWTESPT